MHSPLNVRYSTMHSLLNVRYSTMHGPLNVRYSTMHGPLNVTFLSMALYDTIHVAVIGIFNPLSAELNPVCYLLALLAHHFLHVSRIRVKSLTP